MLNFIQRQVKRSYRGEQAREITPIEKLMSRQRSVSIAVLAVGVVKNINVVRY